MSSDKPKKDLFEIFDHYSPQAKENRLAAWRKVGADMADTLLLKALVQRFDIGAKSPFSMEVLKSGVPEASLVGLSEKSREEYFVAVHDGASARWNDMTGGIDRPTSAKKVKSHG